MTVSADADAPHGGSDPVSLASETLIPLAALASRHGLHVSALHRAARVGTLGRPDARGARQRVHLGTIKVLGRWYTTEEAWIRYIAATNGTPSTATTDPSGAPRRRTAAQRRLDSERAARQCEALGV